MTDAFDLESHEPLEVADIAKGEPSPPPTKQRPGDQPLPVVNEETDIQTLVIEDIERRREVGISRYGTALQPFNGRDPLQDAYEEAIDLAMYLKQMMVERDRGEQS